MGCLAVVKRYRARATFLRERDITDRDRRGDGFIPEVLDHFLTRRHRQDDDGDAR
jgi:hypothetical protein